MARRITEKQHDEAFRVLRAEYYSHIREVADDLAASVRDGEIADEEGFWDAAHTAIDGARWTFITHMAYQTLYVSDNESAVEDDLGELPPADSLSGVVTVAAYYAQMADLRDLVHADDDYAGLFEDE